MNRSSVEFSPQALVWLEGLLCQRFGYRFMLRQEAGQLVLSIQGSEKAIRCSERQTIFHHSASDFPCESWNASAEGFRPPVEDCLPAPSSRALPTPLVQFDDSGAAFGYDVFGLCYWMLTRLEEIGRQDLDSHQRFPASASHAFKNQYLGRPIVDEWLIILGQVIERVWPGIRLKKHQFSIRMSHDVDRPSLYGFQPWSAILRMMAGHLLKRRDLGAFFQAPRIKLGTKDRLHPEDPFNTFEWLMDVAEQHGQRSAFYFICGRTDPRFDADYDPEHPAIRALMRRIHERGHEIGLHPSYNTFASPELIKLEAERLKRICREEGIEQKEWGGRMHYLRWSQPRTLRGWSCAGLDYDSTLGFGDTLGFRCGTCHEFSGFDAVEQIEVGLQLRPLILMESSLFLETHKNQVSNPERKLDEIKRTCLNVGGAFNILWHNSSLSTAFERRLLSYSIGGIYCDDA